MAAHKGPASLRPRCIRSGSSVAAIPVHQSMPGKKSGNHAGLYPSEVQKPNPGSPTRSRPIVGKTPVPKFE
jgi:hypothetical protein